MRKPGSAVMLDMIVNPRKGGRMRDKRQKRAKNPSKQAEFWADICWANPNDNFNRRRHAESHAGLDHDSHRDTAITVPVGADVRVCA